MDERLTPEGLEIAADGMALESKESVMRKAAELWRADQKRLAFVELQKGWLVADIVGIIAMYGEDMHPRTKQALDAISKAYPTPPT